MTNQERVSELVAACFSVLCSDCRQEIVKMLDEAEARGRSEATAEKQPYSAKGAGYRTIK